MQYDSGETESGKAFRFSSDASTARTATRFYPPFEPGKRVTLDQVSLSHAYVSQGAPQIPDAPRDFELYIWDETYDEIQEIDVPGQIIFRETMQDTRQFMPITKQLRFMDIDMSPYADRIGSLPQVIYVGIGETGEDENYQVVLPSPYAGGNESFVFTTGRGQWRRLWDIQLRDVDTDPLRGFVIGTRARFNLEDLTGVSVETSELPDAAHLIQNYPNPFSGETRISYHLDRRGPVRVTVMDLLGRRLAVLVDSDQAAGEHHVYFDGTDLSNGVYIYRLETEGRVDSHKMILVR